MRHFMKRTDFGLLVRALRKEIRDSNLSSMTQTMLAEQSGLSERTIIRLEKGEPIKLRGEQLNGLAEALKLTSGERREFFLAAADIDNSDFTSSSHTSQDEQATLQYLLDILRSQCLPAFISDTYFDMLAVNVAIISLFEMNVAEVDSVINHSTVFNTLRFFFSPEFERQQDAMLNWDDLIFQNIMDFRTSSLRYRGTQYFDELLNALLAYPNFRRYWRDIKWEEKDHVVNGGEFQLKTKQWGVLKFVVPVFTVLSSHGILGLSVYTPTTPHTMSVFKEIHDSTPQHILRLAQWPKE